MTLHFNSLTCSRRGGRVPSASVVYGDRRLTFAQFDERATRLAHHLQAQGVGAGDRVGLYLYNCNEYLEAALAAFKLRASPVNINFRYVEEELRYLFDDADLVALDLPPRVRAARRRRRADAARAADARVVEDGMAMSGAAPARRRPTRDAARVRIGARRAQSTRARLRRALRRRRVPALHGRHDGHAEGRDVAARGRLLRRAAGRQPGRARHHGAGAARRRTLRPRESRPTTLPVAPLMHGNGHWSCDDRPARRRQGRARAVAPARPARDLVARRARAGERAVDRRRRDGAAAGRRAGRRQARTTSRRCSRSRRPARCSPRT